MTRIIARTALPILVAAVAAFCLLSCKQPVADDSPAPTAYTVGYYYNGATLTPCYWENTTKIDLPIPAAAAYGAEGTAIAVDSGDVWVAGWYMDDGYKRVPCLWKNGVYLQKLENVPTYHAEPSSITIYNGKFYCGGYLTEASGIERACWWIDKDVNVLSATYPGRATGLCWSNGHLYASGWYTPASVDLACYWEVADPLGAPAAAVQQDLPGVAGARSGGNGIAVSGNDVYVAGYYGETIATGILNRACYWRGIGARTSLSGFGWNDASTATCISISDGLVYTAGQCDASGGNSPAAYWLGSSYHGLTIEGQNDLYPAGIGVGGGTVYIAGYYNSVSLGVLQPGYWEGDTFHALPASPDGDSRALAICVVE